MSFVFPTNASQVQAFAGALFGVQVGSATMAQVNADILANGGLNATLNGYYAASFGSNTAGAASAVAKNLGLTGAALTEGTAYITAQLNAAAPSARGAVISNIVNLFGTYTTDATFGAAATAWNTKLAIAVAYTGATNEAIGTVVVPSTTFSLVTTLDSLTGTAGNDTYTAIVGAGTGVTTANTGDVINGGAGIDTLAITAVDAANPGLLQTSNLENVTVRALGAVVADALLMDGYTSYLSNASSAALTVNNAAIAATHGVKNSLSGNAANLTVNFRGADVAGAADVANISLEGAGSSVLASGATSPTITRVAVAVGAGAESIALTTTGNNFATVAGQVTTATLTLSGSGVNDIDVGTLRGTSTINAAASSAANTLNLGSAVTTGDAIIGGSGADTVTFTAAQTATISVTGVETLQVDGGTAVTTFSANPALANLNIRSTAATTLAGVSTLSNLNYQGDATAGYAGTSGNVTLNTAFAGTADALAISIGNRGTLANGSFNAGTLGANGIEGVTVTQTNMASTGTTTFSIVNTGLKTIAVTTPGTLALSIDTRASSTAYAPTNTGTNSTTGSNSVTAVDLSGVAGSSNSITFQAGTFATGATVKAAVGGSTFVVGTETAADAITFTGGAGVDSFTTGTAGTFTATLGGGATNVFNGGSLAAAASGNTANVTGGEGADTITGGANNDTINGGAGNDIITGGLGADVIDGAAGADTYAVAVGVAAVTAVAEVQTITPVATGGAVADIATVLVAVVGGKTVSVALPASTTVANASSAIANALNAASGGSFVAVASTTAVTVTHAAASGNVAPIQLKFGVDGTITAIGTAVGDTGAVTLAGGVNAATASTVVTAATATQGVAAVARTDSDSTSTALDILTFVSGADIIDVVAGAIVINGGTAAGTTAAVAGNAATSAAGLATFEASDNTLALKITAVAADLDGAAAVREAAVFTHDGQAYLYISDGVALHTSSDALIVLTGITTLANGITLNAGSDIIAIS